VDRRVGAGVAHAPVCIQIHKASFTRGLDIATTTTHQVHHVQTTTPSVRQTNCIWCTTVTRNDFFELMMMDRSAGSSSGSSSNGSGNNFLWLLKSSLPRIFSSWSMGRSTSSGNISGSIITSSSAIRTSLSTQSRESRSSFHLHSSFFKKSRKLSCLKSKFSEGLNCTDTLLNETPQSSFAIKRMHNQ